MSKKPKNLYHVTRTIETMYTYEVVAFTQQEALELPGKLIAEKSMAKAKRCRNLGVAPKEKR